jgi:hypothetical protein
MIREKITINDYERISRENEYYIWHFVRKTNMGNRAIFSIFDEPEFGPDMPHELRAFLEICDIPYFESYVEDSVDFLDNLIQLSRLLNKNDNKLNTCVLGFNKRRMVTSTMDGHCLCVEGISEIIYKLNPDFIEQINLD